MVTDEEIAAIGMETTINRFLEQIRELEGERDRLYKQLHDLTPMGSEFVANPRRCLEWIATELESRQRLIVTQVGRTREAERERDRLLVHLAAAAGRLGYGDAGYYLRLSTPGEVIKAERRLSAQGKALALAPVEGAASV